MFDRVRSTPVAPIIRIRAMPAACIIRTRHKAAAIQRSAKRLATVLAMPDTLWLTDKNPLCCLWLEVKQWNPNPSDPGYIVILQDGGGRVIASDVEQLEKAIDRITKLRKKSGKRVKLPKGIFTNYPVIE